MNAVFLAGRGLVSTLGGDLASAVSAVRAGGVTPVRREVAPGVTWPFQAINDSDTDWWARTQRLVMQAVSESGAPADVHGRRREEQRAAPVGGERAALGDGLPHQPLRAGPPVRVGIIDRLEGPRDTGCHLALQVSMAIQERYGVRMPDSKDTRRALTSIAHLAEFLRPHLAK